MGYVLDLPPKQYWQQRDVLVIATHFIPKVKDFFTSNFTPPVRRWGMHKKVTDKRDNLYHMLSCSAIKDWGKKKGGDVPGT